MSVTEPNHLRYLGDLKCFVIGSFIAYYHCGHESFFKEQKEQQLRQRQASSCVNANSLRITLYSHLRMYLWWSLCTLFCLILSLDKKPIDSVIDVSAHYICTSI